MSWVPEAHVQQAVSLVQDKHAQIRQHRPQLLHVLQVVQQPPRRGHLHAVSRVMGGRIKVTASIRCMADGRVRCTVPSWTVQQLGSTAAIEGRLALQQ